MNTSSLLTDIGTLTKTTTFSCGVKTYAIAIVNAIETPVFSGIGFKHMLVTIGCNIMNINRHGNKTDIEFTYKAYLQFMRLCREFSIWITYDLVDGNFVGRIA